MKSRQIIIQVMMLIILTILLLPAGISAQENAAGMEQEDVFTKEELTQMLAPIALYPDSLISQILMASTYPIEIVEAERWLHQNEDLRGDELNDALQEMTWDISVKSLCHFPDVLYALSDRLDHTKKLGDAFLSQEEDVMATIQELRRKANEQGNLMATKEQKVIIEKEIIRVEPTDPQVVYVPVYDPFYVYGPWWYSAYPPWYWYYPRNVVVTGGAIYFGSGFSLGIGISSWSWIDWHLHYIYIDVNKARRFHRFREQHDSDRYFWRHNPSHRRGVAYRDRRTSERFRPELPRLPRARPETRGYPSRSPLEQRRGDEPKVRTQPERSRSPIEQRKRDESKIRTQPAGSRSPVVNRSRVVPRAKIQRKSDQEAKHADTPFRGIGNGNFERRAGERGDYSRQSDKQRNQDRESRQSSQDRAIDNSGIRRHR